MRKPSHRIWRRCVTVSGWSTANVHSVDPRKYCAISRATPSGIKLLQHQPAEQAREHPDGEEEAGPAGDPALTIEREAAAQREGFERVLSLVALGEVGIVGSREVSRLSRTDKDWCRLLEVCQIFGTLIADEQQVYDLTNLDDQLVLGIKGTLQRRRAQDHAPTIAGRPGGQSAPRRTVQKTSDWVCPRPRG